MLALDDLLAGASDDPLAVTIDPEDASTLLYTSGTTGNPKGVMLTQANWAYEAKATREIALMQPDDAIMLFLPLAHSFAQVIKASWLGLGFRMIFAEKLEKLIDF